MVVLHLLQPNLDLLSRFVSEYAPGPSGRLMNVAFVALTATLAAFATLMGRRVRLP